MVGVGSVGGQPGIQDMAERIKVLEGQLKEMQDEMTVASVQIGTAAQGWSGGITRSERPAQMCPYAQPSGSRVAPRGTRR